VNEPVFTPWPKIARLNREITITEKIDGTNAAIGIVAETIEVAGPGGGSETVPTGRMRAYAQSRNRILTPGKSTDNFGFAAWVEKNADVLIKALGPGLHFGEWWGVGIGAGYGLTERRFSLFNTAKWGDAGEGALALALARSLGVALYAVPVLYTGPWLIDGLTEYEGDRFAPGDMISQLHVHGSVAAPGFMEPEGIVVFHKASGQMFKATVVKDEQWKLEGR
jgi:hypothetical protein